MNAQKLSQAAECKGFGKPDEIREFPLGKLELVKIGGAMVARATFQPGWRWSTHMKAKAGTESCQVAHKGYFVSGRMKIVMDDGEEAEYGPGDFMEVPPGHDAWIVGDEPCVAIDGEGGATCAKPS